MSFIQRWNVESIISQLRQAGRECSSSYNDGFVAWGCKQDLYQIYFELHEILNYCPEFAGEKEYLNEKSKKQMWEKLNKVTGNT